MNKKSREEAQLMADLIFKLEKICYLKESHFCKTFNISPMEFRCIKQLENSCFLSLKELSKSMNLTPSRISHLVNRMENKKLIEKKENNYDKRVVKICLTEEGLNFITLVNDEYVRLHEEILKPIEEDKREIILDSLQTVFSSINNYVSNHY